VELEDFTASQSFPQFHCTYLEDQNPKQTFPCTVLALLYAIKELASHVSNLCDIAPRLHTCK